MAAIDILPPEPGPTRRQAFHRAGGNVVDARFVTVRRAARQPGEGMGYSPNFSNQSSSPANLVALKMRSKAVVEKTERALLSLSADWFAAMVALLFVIVFGFSGGFTLFLGQSDTLIRGKQLDLTHVNLVSQNADGEQILVITGIVENNGPDRLDLPVLRADLMLGDNVVADTLIELPVTKIEGGESHGFSAHVPYHGGKMPELRLSFASSDASLP